MQRTPIKGRVLLLLSDRRDADELAQELDAEGWSCVVGCQATDLVVNQIRDCRPVAAIIDVSQAAEPGISVAVAVRADPDTCAVPIVFIGASRVVEQAKAKVPDAIFASRGALDYLLNELVRL